MAKVSTSQETTSSSAQFSYAESNANDPRSHGETTTHKLLLDAPRSVEVEFANDSKFSLSAEFLRVYSPAADGKIRSIGGERVISGRRHVGIMAAEPDYFYNLGSNKFTLMRNYIKTLKKHELSRDPPKRKWNNALDMLLEFVGGSNNANVL